MYLQLTTRCNMTCAHCCFSANHQGDDMSEATFRQALKFAHSLGEYLVLGGGEPTVHPAFLDLLGLAIVHNPMAGEMPVLVVTNGKRKSIALRLAELARDGTVQAELSLDEFHDPISQEVVMAFQPRERQDRYFESGSRDLRGVRSVERIVPVGRGLTEETATEREGCCCESLLVDPSGKLYACGCKTIELGTVWEPNLPQDYDGEWAHDSRAQAWLEEHQELLAA